MPNEILSMFIRVFSFSPIALLPVANEKEKVSWIPHLRVPKGIGRGWGAEAGIKEASKQKQVSWGIEGGLPGGREQVGSYVGLPKSLQVPRALT